jgi:UDP-3-O-[3-hydroxymyristoyl] glucosamine N-acyltransferase
VTISAFSIIGKCEIGENSIIGSHSIIKDGVIIGKNVVIREHCLIGGPGFGMVRDEHGHVFRMPHIGHTVIEDDVEIFPYTNVDRATFGLTRIKRGAKLDHYVHVGHNSQVGLDTIVTAGVVFCGKSSVGDRAWLGVGSILKEGVVVEDDTFVGFGSVVLKTVKAGTTVIGVPARPLDKK